MENYRLRKGFTLAEVLITLGIIGIVAAMTIPTLISKYQKKILHTQFLKAYSDLQNVAKRFQADEGITVYEYSQKESSTLSTNTLKRLMEYFIGVEKGSITITNYTNTIENALGFIPKNLKGEDISVSPCDRSIVTEEIGGRFFSMDDPVSVYNNPPNGPKICVDINGKKGPNIYGYDWFVFTFTKDGGVKPFIGRVLQNLGLDMEDPADACNYDYESVTYTCAYFAATNTSPEDPSKDYWNDFLK